MLIPAVLVTGFCAPLCLNQKTGKINQIVPVMPRRSIASGSQTLYIKNMQDYIYECDPENGYDAPDLVEQFVTYAREELGYTKAEVIYDTTDTNETLFSEMQTGKSSYDLVCPSDYMIQKLISNDMLYKLTDEDKAKVPNYFGEDSYASVRIKNSLDNIKVEREGKETEYLRDYAVGYMWGTLGILFNPEYSTFEAHDISYDEVIADMSSWSNLWDKKYKGTLSVKDSMRDTYCIGVLETYKDELLSAKETYQEDRKTDEEAALAAYQTKLDEIFNRSDYSYIKEVEPVLKELKYNSFGLECDSGKEDIVTGKIGINLAWSGDAVYSMEKANDDSKLSEPFQLYYSIPDVGSNVWFDAWVIPNTPRSDAQKELALAFLNFISDPENATQNMDYIGYTPFIAGDTILELARDWYDFRTNYIYATEDYLPVYYYDGDEKVVLDYTDFFEERTGNEPLYYSDEYDDDENPVGEDIEFLDPMAEDEQSAAALHYNDLVAALKEVDEIDLSYFFGGTLSDEYSDEDMVFYSDCYYATYEDEEGNEVVSESVGMEFYCQFPDIETINRCSVMRDYGKNNSQVMKMWERFKSDPLPVWGVAVFIVEGIAIIGGVTFYFIRKKSRLDIRHKRKAANN